MGDRPPVTEIESDSWIQAVVFSANGEYLVSGGYEGVRVWRVQDGKQMATMHSEEGVWCLAVSKDGKWIAAGTTLGGVYVWNAKTYEEVFMLILGDDGINGVDFSPDSTRLVTASIKGTATVWDIATRKRVLDLFRHKDIVTAAKYSPQGDRIATATHTAVRVHDSNDGRLLVDIPVKVTAWYNNGLAWSNDQLFVISDGKIKQVEASPRSTVSEWAVSGTAISSCIALSQHCGEFIAYSTNRTVTVWDGSTHSQLGLIQHTRTISSIALSPDDRFVAVGGGGTKITIHSLSRIPMPFMDIPATALEPWEQDRLADVESSLTRVINNSGHPSHHALANRALIRARLGYRDSAIDDAEMSINIQPSVIGYIAKSVALIGDGKSLEVCRAYDLVFMFFRSYDVDPLLLIKAVVLFMAGEHQDAISRVDDLIIAVPSNSICYLVQAYMYLLLGNSQMENKNYEDAIQSFERARAQMRSYVGLGLFTISLISGWKFDGLGIIIRQRLCEALYAAGLTKDAGESLLEMVKTFDKVVYTSRPITKWVSDFTHQFLSAPGSEGDAVSNAASPCEATMLQSVLDSTTPALLLREWAKSTLTSDAWKHALVAAADFMLPRSTIYQVICERLDTTDNATDAIECLQQMESELEENTDISEQAKWLLDFKQHCVKKIVRFGDAAADSQRYEDAISHYSAALSLNPAVPQGIHIKRSRAYAEMGSWDDALNDANQVIKLDPSSPLGYERKYVAFREAGRQTDMLDSFELMLSRMEQSPDPEIRERFHRFAEAKETIRRAIRDTIRESPRALINTTSGRLCNKSEQAAAFEQLPAFTELILSMTTHIDYTRIKNEVTEYYLYATFSHKWEDNEPLYEKVVNIVVYELEESPTHDKLQMFCKIVRDTGFHWAWSDTCCINKADHLVLQEALVAMFRWYQGSAMTIVLLLGVRSPSRRGDLVKSIWNTRAWTFQEYHASKVVRFYNEDWTLYRNINVPNHKKSPEIISEMEEATGVSAQALIALQPGLDNIREKLCLASRRETTLDEDSAYSLLGIFTVTLSVVYGEGDRALGRLLAQLLTSSGDTSILAWTGVSGSFNSSLPADITVFHELPTSHIPLAIDRAQMDTIIAGLRPSLNHALVMKLYDQLNGLPVPWFTGHRVKLPCITFKLGPVSAFRSRSEYVCRAQTAALGIVGMRTKVDLSHFDSLYLIHPWIDFLLDRQPVGSVRGTTPEEIADDRVSFIGELPSSLGPSNVALEAPQTRAARLAARLGLPFGGPSATSPRDVASLRPPSSLSPMDRKMQALRVIARLRKPFGALLVTPYLGHVAAYRRVAAESRITVQVVEDMTAPILNKLIDGVRVLDVL